MWRRWVPGGGERAGALMAMAVALFSIALLVVAASGDPQPGARDAAEPARQAAEGTHPEAPGVVSDATGPPPPGQEQPTDAGSDGVEAPPPDPGAETAGAATDPPPPPAPPPPVPPPPPPPPLPDAPPWNDPSVVELRPGDAGLAVAGLQERLAGLAYWLAGVTGEYDGSTVDAVMAFQKVEGLERTGVADSATLERMRVAGRAAPLEYGDGIEVHRALQVTLVVREGQAVWIFNTSTGRRGWTTPSGTFTMTRQIDGLRRSKYGRLWRPKYFVGGVALHGGWSVPAQPASSGCVRVSLAAMDFVWDLDLAPVGTQVRVY